MAQNNQHLSHNNYKNTYVLTSEPHDEMFFLVISVVTSPFCASSKKSSGNTCISQVLTSSIFLLIFCSSSAKTRNPVL